MSKHAKVIKYPGVPAAMDGNSAVILCERESTDAAGAYPITPSTQMGEYWAEAAAKGHLNISDRPLIFVEPEGEHAAAAVTAGLAMTGLRAANFSSGQGIAYMHESLYAAVGKRLTYVLNIGARAMTKATLNVHAGHDDYHCIDDTGFFQLFAKDAQSAADLNIIAHRIAELSLNPGAVAQDGFLTTHLIESILVPEREMIAEYLGRPDDLIPTPTPAQRLIYGDTRRRIPELWDVDHRMMSGVVQNQDSYMQSVAAQRPFFFDHIRDLTDRAFSEFVALTGRKYERVSGYRAKKADYLIVGQGSLIPTAEAVADYLRASRGLRVGVVNVQMFRPFPSDLIGKMLKGKKGVTVLERLDQPLAAELPLMREIRSVVSRCLENGRVPDSPAYPDLACYESLDETPQLYSGSFGMGSRDLQPEGIIGAVENMLPHGAGKRFFYVSIDFLHEHPRTPKQRIHQEAIEEAYPTVRELSIKGSENPNLMPKDSITIRFHSVGGWGAITTGKNLALTLYELLGYHIKANPKYGSEKKGQPTTYYLSASPNPIRINCEYYYVDVVLSPDANVFQHTNAIAGLKEGGSFIIQSDADSAEEVWNHIPASYRDLFIAQKIKLFYVDGFRIAREEASDPDLRLRMQGIAFQGAFFAASGLTDRESMTEERLLSAIENQLQHKFGAKGARVVAENLRVVKRGFDEVQRVPYEGFTSELHEKSNATTPEPALPTLLKSQPQSQQALSDIHRFWEQTASFYSRGEGSDNLADPFMSTGTVPAVTAIFRDMSGIRFQHPTWIAENCTACGNCYTVCPDTAIPGLVSDVSQVFDTALERLRAQGKSISRLRSAVRKLEPQFRQRLMTADEHANVRQLLTSSINAFVNEAHSEETEKAQLRKDFDQLEDQLGDFQFAATLPYFENRERKQPGDGGLLSITINPQTCKGCMECVNVCDDDALRTEVQTPDSISRLRKNWEFWLDLPSSPKKYIRVDDLEEAIGALHTILLEKQNYSALTSGDGACLGCGEKSVVHLFTATVEALMQPRVEQHVAYLSDLIERLEKHIQLKLIHEIDVGDTKAITAAMTAETGHSLTLAQIAEHLESHQGGEPIDRDWLSRVIKLVAQLKELKWKYTDGHTGQGRAHMGILNSTGCSSVWGSTFPYNPYPYPWSNHLFQDAASVSMGIFEGHMAKMADGFRAIRKAELELEDEYVPATHDEFFTYFGWHDFNDEEWDLCPPVVAIGGDGAMYDIGFQNLSRALMSGKPIKVLVLDTQVYSNTGGQACTAGFFGQISDMAQHGKAVQGKQEIRKEIGLIGMAHRTAYVMQSTIAHPNHMIEGFIKGLQARRPALFNLYTSCQPEHGIGDDLSAHQAKLVVESRGYPLFRYDPSGGPRPENCFDLEGNPSIEKDWPSYELTYCEDGTEKTMSVPMTFADFAATENRFRKHFRTAPPETWNENMIALHEFLELDEAAREGMFPFIWSVDRKKRLMRLVVAKPMVIASEERRDFWTMLRALARVGEFDSDREGLEAKLKQQITQRIAANIMQLAGEQGATSGNDLEPAGLPASSGEGMTENPTEPSSTAAMYVAPWIETERCTACDECIKLNADIFAYNADKKAYIHNPTGGPFQDLVKAAERCTAQIIHPGLPESRTDREIEKWIARAEKYN